MTVYVDDLFTAVPHTAQARRHGNQWCHMIADGDLTELHQMAARIGLKKSYFQHCSIPHYDLTPAMRQRAIQNGAIAADREQLTPIRRAWMQRWHGGSPDWEVKNV